MSNMNDKPICKVSGMLSYSVTCGYVLNGGKNCGFSGNCPHKSYDRMDAAPEVK